MIKVINARGRVLLEVTEEVPSEVHGKLYAYTGDGVGGFTTRASLESLIECIKIDAPSARVVGEY